MNNRPSTPIEFYKTEKTTRQKVFYEGFNNIHLVLWMWLAQDRVLFLIEHEIYDNKKDFWYAQPTVVVPTIPRSGNQPPWVNERDPTLEEAISFARNYYQEVYKKWHENQKEME